MLVFDDLRSDSITIRSRKSEKSLTVKANGFPYWGIWAPEKGGAPFICIEPWYGHADYADFVGEFAEKEGKRYNVEVFIHGENGKIEKKENFGKNLY